MSSFPRSVADITFHSLALDDLDRFQSMPTSSGALHPQSGRNFLAMMAAGVYRPDWTWIAESGGVVLARAAWWGTPQSHRPIALDWFDVIADRAGIEVGAELLRTADRELRTADAPRPEFHLVLPEGWEDRPDATVDKARIAASIQAGWQERLERWRLDWNPDCRLPRSSGRLVLRPPIPDDNAPLIDVLERILVGTLDFYSQEDIAEQGIAATAREDLTFLAGFPSPREWWQVAYDENGALVGLVVPARNYEGPIIAYLGVVPEQRGRGYGLDLVIEATRLLGLLGAEQIVADTDVANIPMANAFRAAGYRFSRHKVLS
jgi:RimJ/RimL family protein N-acetyltransferase